MKNLVSNLAKNQIIIENRENNIKEFYSYSTKIAEQNKNITFIDSKKWNFSNTTIKYLCEFLGYKNKNEILAGFQSGDLFLKDLNN